MTAKSQKPSDVTAQVEALATRVDGLSGQVSTVLVTLSDFIKSQHGVQKDVGACADVIGFLNQSIATMREDVRSAREGGQTLHNAQAQTIAKLDRLTAGVAQIHKRVHSEQAPSTGGRAPARPQVAPRVVATDADLDGPHGDPAIRFDPKRWTGDSYKGATMSACPGPFLKLYAEALEFFADREDEKGERDRNGNAKSKWTRLDASRAWGWAARAARAVGPAPAPRVLQDPNTARPDENKSQASDDDISF